MNNKEVANIITQGRAYKSSFFLLKMAINKEKITKNTSFLAPKKQFKTAVLRNKAKRRMKSLVQNNLNVAKNKDFLYVYTMYPSILKAEFKDLQFEFEQFLQKNDILKTK